MADKNIQVSQFPISHNYKAGSARGLGQSLRNGVDLLCEGQIVIRDRVNQDLDRVKLERRRKGKIQVV